MARLGTLLAVVVGAIAIAMAVATRSASTNDAAGQGRYAGERYGFSASVPAGWRRARARLVPKLLSPREILSLATFAMPVGGGGNCGREPIAAIERMETGDALVSIQEYTLDGAMRARTGTRSAPSPRLESVKELALRKQAHPRGERIPAERALWSTTLSFSDHGRWFDALVYVKGDPMPSRLHQIHSILDRLRFRPLAGIRNGLPSRLNPTSSR
jgi:hypothetical protein